MRTNASQPGWFTRAWLGVLCIAVDLNAPAAFSQNCMQFDIQTFRQAPPAGLFGITLAMQDDIAVTGDPVREFAATELGAVYVLRHDGDQWAITQELMAADPQRGSKFGMVVAIDGDRIAVSAPRELLTPFKRGAVHIFRQQPDGVFVPEGRVSHPNENAASSFGESIALHGDEVVVGAPGTATPNNAGDAFVFKYDGNAWSLAQTIVPVDGALNDQFGHTVALGDEDLLIGAIDGNSPGWQNDGTVYAYRRDAGQWTLVQEIAASEPWNFGLFGKSLALDGVTAAIGHRSSSNHPGAVEVWTRDGESWVLEQRLEAPTTANRAFGHSVDVDGDLIAVGDPAFQISYQSNTGAGFLFRRSGRDWIYDHSFTHRKLSYSYPYAQFGAAIAVNNEHLLIASQRLPPGILEGLVCAFDPLPPDCNQNGIVDTCEDSDCNGNGVSDWCELADGSALDCDRNGRPDECDAPARYTLDDGDPKGYLGHTQNFVQELLWLNQFNVLPGQSIVDHIAMPRGPWHEYGLPITFLLYDDPNNDGNPGDALQLASVTIPYITGPDVIAEKFMFVPIDPTVVGAVGDSFFVAARAIVPPNMFPGTIDSTPGTLGRSWITGGMVSEGLLNLEDLSQNEVAPFIIFEWDWILRAMTFDCNANQQMDSCDIADGLSLDLNANGIPDECERPLCLPDIAPIGAPNGEVNVDDLLAVINAWGACADPNNCPADIAPAGGDDQVNVDDLLAVINGWGPCGK